MPPVPNVYSEISYFPYPIGSERKPYFVETANGKMICHCFCKSRFPDLVIGFLISAQTSCHVTFPFSFRHNVGGHPFFGHFFRQGLSYVSFEILFFKCCQLSYFSVKQRSRMDQIQILCCLICSTSSQDIPLPRMVQI